ncbi:hypothetical protein SAMN05421866_2117 [Chryseobacterium oranimense]|uniref:Uncharacterized protein n=1 Tax=Chryseobacterium oranimense TaxID=421058 RepID=A0A1M5Q8M3_9FLAO|nr:hypothetical protein [Chryseobacterium oranimense]SHH09823.1 hypothetical protein SAMN05421866_2117 [Chryseobacterium oranimense]
MATKKHFFVSLEGVDLSDEQLKSIDRGIQSVVLSELSKIDNSQAFGAHRDFKGLVRPLKIKDWFPWGIIIFKPGIDIQSQIKDIQSQIKMYGG